MSPLVRSLTMQEDDWDFVGQVVREAHSEPGGIAEVCSAEVAACAAEVRVTGVVVRVQGLGWGEGLARILTASRRWGVR